MDTPVLDGLPRDWPHDMAPGRNRDPHTENTTSSQAWEHRSAPSRAIPDINSPLNSETEPGSSPPHVVSQLDTARHLPQTPRSDPERGSFKAALAQYGVPLPTYSHHVRSKLDDPCVRDLGWGDEALTPTVLAIGISNEQVFALVRRFNQVRQSFSTESLPSRLHNQHVRSVRTLPSLPSGVMDMEIAEDEEFSPDKLRENLERLYITLVRGIM